MVMKGKSDVIRLVYIYIKLVCALSNTPEAAEQAKAAFRHVPKSHDTNNGRKVRSSGDLMFLSWARLQKDAGLLKDMLSTEPWEIDADAQDAIITGLQVAFDTVNETGESEAALQVRIEMRKALHGLIMSESTDLVGPTYASFMGTATPMTPH